MGAGTVQSNVLCERIVVLGKKDLVGKWGIQVCRSFLGSNVLSEQPADRTSLCIALPQSNAKVLSGSTYTFHKPYATADCKGSEQPANMSVFWDFLVKGPPPPFRRSLE